MHTHDDWEYLNCLFVIGGGGISLSINTCTVYAAIEMLHCLLDLNGMLLLCDINC
jgi:hypothetical protein